MMENEGDIDSVMDDQDFIVETANDLRSFVSTQVLAIDKTVKVLHAKQKELAGRVEKLQQINTTQEAEIRKLAARVEKLEQVNTTQEAEISKLREENGAIRESVQKSDKSDKCLKVVQRALASAQAIIADPTTDPIERLSAALQIPFPQPVLYATPLDASTPDVKRKQLSMKRKVCETITVLNDTLNDVDPKFRDIIEPFYKEDPRANCDFLNDVQRAFIKYRASTILLTKESITPVLARQVIREGCDQNIWTEDMLMSDGSSDFETYMVNRLRNEKKSLQRRQSRSETKQLCKSGNSDISDYCEKSVGQSM